MDTPEIKNAPEEKQEKGLIRKRFPFYKAMGHNNMVAIQKAGGSKNKTTSAVYGSKLMKDPEVLREIQSLKETFKRDIADLATENIKDIVKMKPDLSNVKAETWLKANLESLRIAGYYDKEEDGKIKKRQEFIQQFIIKRDVNSHWTKQPTENNGETNG